MSHHQPPHPPIFTIPSELTDAILITRLRSIFPVYDDASSLWSISTDQWKPISRMKLEEYFQLRYTCTSLNHRIEDIGLSWSLLPLGQMDIDDLTVALKRSNGRPLTVIVNDIDSVGLFWPLVKMASDRIRTLYIDLDADHWPAVSTSLQVYSFDQLHNLFLGARGVLEDREELGGLLGGTVGGLGNGLVAASISGQHNDGSSNDDDGEDVPMRRHSTQASHTRDLARLQDLPLTVLCIRHSSFPFHQFTPPSRVVTLHIHKSHGGHHPFILDLVHFNRALPFMQHLSELELWDVEVVGSSDVVPISHPNIRCAAFRGHAASVNALTHYIHLCPRDVVVTELFHNRVVNPVVLDAHAVAIAQSFSFPSAVSSVGIFLKVKGTIQWHATIDLVLKSSEHRYMSIRVPAIHAHVLAPIITDCISLHSNARLCFDMTEGNDPGEMVHRIFHHCIPLDRFRFYQLCIQERYVSTIFHALDTMVPRLSDKSIVFHGDRRFPCLLHTAVSHPLWIESASAAVEPHCEGIRPSRTGRWVSTDGKEVFSPSVDLSHDHLMRMLSYESDEH